MFALPVTAAEVRRNYEVNDIFKLESIGRYFGGPYAFSPNGESLAFTRVRPASTLVNHKWEYLWGNAGGDVWVQTSFDSQPENITLGDRDGSGWWAPQWSPDGRRLAMLSTRGGNVRLWLWDPQSRQARLLSERGVDTETQDLQQRPFLWVDAQHVLYPALSEGVLALGMRLELETPAAATREWSKTPKGKETTVNVLDSGVPVDLALRPHGQLRLLDVTSGQERVVVDNAVATWRIAPDGGAIAFTKQVNIFVPRDDESLPFELPGTFSVGFAKLDGTPIELKGEMSQDVLRDSLRWSSDGRQLVFLGYGEGGRSRPPSLYRVDLTQSTVTRQSLGELDAAPGVRQQEQLEWTSSGDLIILAARQVGNVRPDATMRRDWWRVDQESSPHVLTSAMGEIPKELWPTDDGRSFVGLAAGDLWRITPAAAEVENLSSEFRPKIAQVVWPSYSYEGIEEWPLLGRTYSQIIVGSRDDGGKVTPYRVDLRKGRITPLPLPAPGAELKAYSPSTDNGIFYRSDDQGLLVWRSNLVAGRETELVETNTFLRNVASGQFRSIEYTSLSGQKLKAWLILPPNYRPGQRYPLLTWVYAGSMAGPVPNPFQRISGGGSLNMQIPAARGYAVLFPSMPLAPEGVADDPMLRLPDGVMPAVDKVVELGIADPGRLFLAGQSFGGFSTYGLVTQTSRFTAAVSLAGPSDLISLYGQFDARLRYTDFSQQNLYIMAMTESAIRMGNPPWKDWWRYLRNSPIFYVDRVQTPLMIIQGDMDYVAMQQGEEFFNALYRQGKRARFVRYWGEGHVLQSPANIRDMWQQIFAWFDEFSPKQSVGAQAVKAEERRP